MVDHIFVNEKKFFQKTRSSVHYKSSDKVKSLIDNFLPFVTLHHLSEKKMYIRQLSEKQYSCLIEFEIEDKKRIQCGIKYNELSNNRLEILFVYFKEI